MALGDKLEVVNFKGINYQAIESGGACDGCAGNVAGNASLCSMDDCTAETRKDGKEVIWIKLEKEQPISKHDAIKEIRAKTTTLQSEIYKLVVAFETDTGMVVHSVDLSQVQLIGENTTTCHVELDVRLN